MCGQSPDTSQGTLARAHPPTSSRSPPPKLKARPTSRASPDDEFPDFVVHEDKERVREGTEPPGRSGSRSGTSYARTQFRGREPTRHHGDAEQRGPGSHGETPSHRRQTQTPREPRAAPRAQGLGLVEGISEDNSLAF